MDHQVLPGIDQPGTTRYHQALTSQGSPGTTRHQPGTTRHQAGTTRHQTWTSHGPPCTTRHQAWTSQGPPGTSQGPPAPSRDHPTSLLSQTFTPGALHKQTQLYFSKSLPSILLMRLAPTVQWGPYLMGIPHESVRAGGELERGRPQGGGESRKTRWGRWGGETKPHTSLAPLSMTQGTSWPGDQLHTPRDRHPSSTSCRIALTHSNHPSTS